MHSYLNHKTQFLSENFQSAFLFDVSKNIYFLSIDKQIVIEYAKSWHIHEKRL